VFDQVRETDLSGQEELELLHRANATTLRASERETMLPLIGSLIRLPLELPGIAARAPAARRDQTNPNRSRTGPSTGDTDYWGGKFSHSPVRVKTFLPQDSKITRANDEENRYTVVVTLPKAGSHPEPRGF
jgi:hypothetical protein